jgi:multisite-specific tRNA:(cytosine-C5)-methyltransferase
MVLPLWRSLHSLNLMLPKEDRRAMLLRIFNSDTPLINATLKSSNQSSAVATPIESTAGAEDKALQAESEQLGEVEQDHTDARETYTKAGDEEDRTNTTV